MFWLGLHNMFNSEIEDTSMKNVLEHCSFASLYRHIHLILLMHGSQEGAIFVTQVHTSLYMCQTVDIPGGPCLQQAISLLVCYTG